MVFLQRTSVNNLETSRRPARSYQGGGGDGGGGDDLSCDGSRDIKRYRDQGEVDTYILLGLLNPGRDLILSRRGLEFAAIELIL